MVSIIQPDNGMLLSKKGKLSKHKAHKEIGKILSKRRGAEKVVYYTTPTVLHAGKS